jgi:hypothetical protein
MLAQQSILTLELNKRRETRKGKQYLTVQRHRRQAHACTTNQINTGIK